MRLVVWCCVPGWRRALQVDCLTTPLIRSESQVNNKLIHRYEIVAEINFDLHSLRIVILSPHLKKLNLAILILLLFLVYV